MAPQGGAIFYGASGYISVEEVVPTRNPELWTFTRGKRKYLGYYIISVSVYCLLTETSNSW